MGILVLDDESDYCYGEAFVNIKKGYSKRSKKHFIIIFRRNASACYNLYEKVTELFNYFSKLECKHLQCYEKLLALRASKSNTVEELVLISEAIDGVNVNDLVGDLGDKLSQNLHKAVTNSVEEILKFDSVKTRLSIPKPMPLLQENGEFICSFNILENIMSESCLPPCQTFTQPRPKQFALDLYKQWYGHHGRLQRDFKNLREIGCGNFGSVYKATHKIDNQTYAIKEIQLKQNDTHREAELLSKIKHTNIVRYHDCWKHGEMLYIRMEYVPHGTLRFN